MANNFFLVIFKAYLLATFLFLPVGMQSAKNIIDAANNPILMYHLRLNPSPVLGVDVDVYVTDDDKLVVST